MGCLINTGKAHTCLAIKKQGGLKGRLWVLNLNNSTGLKLAYTEAGNTVQSGEAAYKVDSSKFSHDFTTSVKKPGANRFYGQAFNLRAITEDELDLVWSDSIVMADSLVFIIETMDKKFIVLGQNNGLDIQEGDLGTSGQVAETDVTETYAFAGSESENKFKFVDVGTGYDDTLAYLISLETPVA